jgi:ANTAR domain/GAF domain
VSSTCCCSCIGRTLATLLSPLPIIGGGDAGPAGQHPAAAPGGPCLESAWEENTIHVPDLENDTRWSDYRRDALAETPIRSIMAFQLYIADESMGALNVYAERPHAFDEESRTIGLIFGAHTSVTWSTARRDEQFRKALASRDVIGQAKGMIMERYGVDAVQAFDMLRKLSQDSNTPVTPIAEDLATTADSPAS